jgi:glutamine amidotransferase|tara:strand:- start:64 stop:699 length:636 start_codon:yes stop_codon:yes gene_type:complete
MADIVIIDYGMGNVHSVAKALTNILDKKSKVKISKSISEIKKSTHIVFPGQGAVSECMSNINKNFEINELKEIIKEKPFLGICMGLQVLMGSSTENNGVSCLDIIDGKVLSIRDKLDKNLKIPHMGWSEVAQQNNHPLWDGIKNKSYFYFVHSYYVSPDKKNDILATTSYGFDFVSAIARENMVAVQFHPEKSSKTGLKLLQNFLSWDGVI